MERRLRDALASHANEYEIGELLHDVPPHVTYEVVVDGRRAVCKLATSGEGHPAVEGQIGEYVGRETEIPAPEVLAVGPDHFIAEWDERVPRSPPVVDESYARAMGAGLATLHEETAGDFEGHGFLRPGNERLELDVREDWHATVRDFLNLRRGYLREIGHADIAAAALAFVREHPDLFAEAGDPVLCHGNYLPDHVGVDDGEVVSVIDFEHALVGPGEYDFWRTALPLASEEGESAVEWFRAGYESLRSLPPGFDRRRAIYTVINTVSYFRSLYLQDQHSAAETERRAERMREHVFDTIDALQEEFA